MPLMLGKKPAATDARDLAFAEFVSVAAVLPKVPANFGHDRNIYADGWRMLGNGPDTSVAPGFEGAGDCVEADACHSTMLWTTETGGTAAPFTGKQAIDLYSAITGYVVGDASTDQGTDMRTALNYRRKTGVTDAAGGVHKIAGYLALDITNHDHILVAMYLFGVVSLGIRFPSSAMDQFNAGQKWALVKGSPIESGHDIPLVGRRGGDYICVTWGQEQAMTVGFLAEYADEAYVPLSYEHLHGGKTPEGLDIAKLRAALAAL